MGRYGMDGPFYPQHGLAASLFTPISRLPSPWVAAGAAIWGSARAGYAAGSYLDRQTHMSDRIGDYAYRRIGPPPNWLMRTAERMGI